MIIVWLLYGYFFLGVVFAVWFTFFKVTKIDEGAAATSVWFRLIILPAAMSLWPVVLYKLFTKK